MSASMLPNALEGPYPLSVGAPPDQQPVDLDGALAMVDSIVWRDGGMDELEQQKLMGWFQQLMMKARAAAMAAAQGQGPPGTASPLGSSSATTDFGSTPGAQDVSGGAGSGPF